MSDPDIPPVVLSDEEIARIQAEVPALPNEYRERWVDLKLDHSVIDTVLAHQEAAKKIGRAHV